MNMQFREEMASIQKFKFFTEEELQSVGSTMKQYAEDLADVRL